MRWPLINRAGEVVAFTQIDEEDLPRLGTKPWSIHSKGYATQLRGSGKKATRFLLHRLLVGLTDSRVVDHINGDKLDNRRTNLRVCTSQQNNFNSSKPRGDNSHLGVHRSRNNWRAKLEINGETILDQTFSNREDAITARLEAERKYFGDFAPNRVGVLAA